MDTTVGGGGGKGRGGFSGRMGRGGFFLGEWGGVLRRRLAGGGVVGNGVDELVGLVCFFCWQDFRPGKGIFLQLPGTTQPLTGTGWW